MLLQQGDGGAVGAWGLGTNYQPIAWISLSGPIPGVVAKSLSPSGILIQSGATLGYWTVSNQVTGWTPLNQTVPPGWLVRGIGGGSGFSYLLLQHGDGGAAGMWLLDNNGQVTAWVSISEPIPGWILSPLTE